MAVSFWVPLASATLNGGAINVSPLNKQTTGDVDETDRVQVGASGNAEFTLSGSPSSMVDPAPHGAVTLVKMHFRIYYSNNGPNSFDFTNYNPFVAPFITVGGTTYYSLPDFADVVGAQSFLGYDFGAYFHNFNQPGEPVAAVYEWNMSSILGSPSDRDDSKLYGCTYGLKMTGDYLGALPFRYSGYPPDPGGGGSTPRYNFTQCILYVEADDPPAPPIVTKPMIMVVG